MAINWKNHEFQFTELLKKDDFKGALNDLLSLYLTDANYIKETYKEVEGEKGDNVQYFKALIKAIEKAQRILSGEHVRK